MPPLPAALRPGRARPWLYTLAYVGLSALDARLAGSSRPAAHRARLVTKPMLMPALAASLATDPRAGSSPLRTSSLVAEGFGWVGDVALLRQGNRAFMVGAGSFGLGHLAYTAGFLARRDRHTRIRDAPAARVATALACTGGPIMALGAARRDRPLGSAVLGYSAVLGSVLATAGHLDTGLPASARRLSLAGAAMFNLSDTLLAVSRFWWLGAPPRTESAVMATYTAAQLMLARGAAGASG